MGDDIYQFDNLLPYYEKSICFTPPNNNVHFANSTPHYEVSVRGNCTGPLSVTYAKYANSFASWSTKELQQLDFSVINGFESGSLIGQSYVMSTIGPQNQKRDSSETSFLRSVLGLPNFTVYTLTMAKKITFDSNKKANEVDTDTLGASYYLTADKEVIVSASVFGSPQLLIVSGIGLAAMLKNLSIPVISPIDGSFIRWRVWWVLAFIRLPSLTLLYLVLP